MDPNCNVSATTATAAPTPPPTSAPTLPPCCMQPAEPVAAPAESEASRIKPSPDGNFGDVDVFVSSKGHEKRPAPNPQTVEDLGEKPPSNINIEIHNVFSFANDPAANQTKIVLGTN